MKRNVVLILGVLLVPVGMALIMPAVAQMRDTGALPSLGVGLLLLGLSLTLAGGWAVVSGAKRVHSPSGGR